MSCVFLQKKEGVSDWIVYLCLHISSFMTHISVDFNPLISTHFTSIMFPQLRGWTQKKSATSPPTHPKMTGGTWLILPFLKRNMIPTRMSQEVSKWLGSVGYKPNISHLKVGYNPLIDLLLTSWDIQVRTIIFLQQLPVVHFQTVTVV